MTQHLKKVFLLVCVSFIGALHAFEDKELEEDPFVRLQQELKEVIFHADETAQIGIKVVSLKDGVTLFEMNPNQRFIPGASLKLLTAAAALKILGPHFCFETKILSDGEIESGKLKGNLYIEGAGDPSLKSTAFEDLIFQLKLRNISEIDGDLVFDASEFDDVALGPGWMWDEKIEFRNSPVDALTMNHSAVKIWVKPSTVVKRAPFVLMQPEVPGLIIENHANMEEIEPSKTAIVVNKRDVMDKDVLRVDGKMSLKSRMLQFKIPVKNPLLYTATEFSVRLKNHHIKHLGKIRFEKRPEGATVLATYLSDPLNYLVMSMLKNNDDLYANCLFKKMGRVKYGKPGTWSNGSQSVRDALAAICQEDFAEAVILDGSGESRYNRITPHLMTAFLQTIYNEFIYAPEFINSLPVAGSDSALKKRLREHRLQGQVRVQPGSLKGVSSLSGYVTTPEHEWLAVSIMINGFIKTNKEIKLGVEDRICSILSQFSRKI